MFVIQLLIQLIVLVTAMVIAGLIMRWIITNPEKCKAAWKRAKRYLATPFVQMRAFRSYLNWKKVGMKFSFQECLSQEWEKYHKQHYPGQPYYRL